MADILILMFIQLPLLLLLFNVFFAIFFAPILTFVVGVKLFTSALLGFIILVFADYYSPKKRRARKSYL